MMNLQDYDRIAVYSRLDGKLAWQYLSAGNSEIMGTDGGQGYENRTACLNAAFRVCGVPKTDDPQQSSFKVGDVTYDLAAEAEQVGSHDGGVVWCYPVRIPE